MKRSVYSRVLVFITLLWPALVSAQAVSASGTVTNVHCHGDSTGSIAYQINGGTGPVHYIWNNGDSGTSVSGCTYIVHITNPGPNLTSFQVVVPVNHATGMNANFSNVQFTDTLGNVLPFWLQDFPSATAADFWVRIPNLPVGTTDIYMNFCDTAAVPGNPSGTFEFFDNFDNNTLPQWTQACLSSMSGTTCNIYADNVTYFSPGYSAHLQGGSTCFTPPYSGAGASISRVINPIVNDSLVLNYEDRSGATLYGYCSGGTSSSNSAQDNSISIGNGQGQGHGGSCASSYSGWAAETSLPFVVSTGTTTITLQEYGGDCDNSDGWFDDVRIRKYTSHMPTVVIDTTPALFLNHLAAGSYVITMTNNGNVSTDTFIVAQPTAVAPLPDSININCHGSSTGSAWLTAPIGGTPGYAFHWSTSQNTDTIKNLSAGLYQITVTDTFGCTGTASVNIIQPPASVSVLADSLNIPCFGQANGKAWVTPSGGTPGYTYLWSNTQTTDTISGLTAANYSVIVTDAAGCRASTSVNITQPAAALTLIADSINVLCYGQATGQASVSASGGTPGYTYQWSNNENTDTIKGLTANIYTVTVKDTLGCIAQATVHITQPASALTVTVTETNATCVGLSNGSAQAAASGGTPAYNYSWSTTAATADITNLSVGSDTVTVTDANHCTALGIAIISPSGDSITIDTTVTDATCGLSNGSITVTPSGGSGGYQFLWSDAMTSATISSLQGGTYNVTITDNAGCRSSRSVSISQSPAIAAVVTTQNDSCDQQKGTASISVTNGTPPYSYIWSPAGTDTAKLDSGTYSVTVTDNIGCTSQATFTIESINNNCQSLVLFPTAFTPNGDGKNDIFHAVYTPDLDKFQMRIYDRWGQLVFEALNYTDGWDGSYKGVSQPIGVYIWFAEYNFTGSKTIYQTGNITLLK